MTAAAELSTGEKLSTALSKKSGRKRENPPCTPYKRKARGKENNPGALSTGLSVGARASAGERVYERIREREARRKRSVEAAVEDALVAFCGTRRNPLFDRDPWKDPCDERNEYRRVKRSVQIPARPPKDIPHVRRVRARAGLRRRFTPPYEAYHRELEAAKRRIRG